MDGSLGLLRVVALGVRHKQRVHVVESRDTSGAENGCSASIRPRGRFGRQRQLVGPFNITVGAADNHAVSGIAREYGVA